MPKSRKKSFLVDVRSTFTIFQIEITKESLDAVAMVAFTVHCLITLRLRILNLVPIYFGQTKLPIEIKNLIHLVLPIIIS